MILEEWNRGREHQRGNRAPTICESLGDFLISFAASGIYAVAIAAPYIGSLYQGNGAAFKATPITAGEEDDSDLFAIFSSFFRNHTFLIEKLNEKMK